MESSTASTAHRHSALDQVPEIIGGAATTTTKHPRRASRRRAVGDCVRVKAHMDHCGIGNGCGRVSEIIHVAPCGTWYSERQSECADDVSAHKGPREDPASAPASKRPREDPDSAPALKRPREDPYSAADEDESADVEREVVDLVSDLEDEDEDESAHESAHESAEESVDEDEGDIVVESCTYHDAETGEMEPIEPAVRVIEDRLNDMYGKRQGRFSNDKKLKFYPHFPGGVVRLERLPSANTTFKICQETILFPELTLWGEGEDVPICGIKAKHVRKFIMSIVEEIRDGSIVIEQSDDE